MAAFNFFTIFDISSTTPPIEAKALDVAAATVDGAGGVVGGAAVVVEGSTPCWLFTAASWFLVGVPSGDYPFPFPLLFPFPLDLPSAGFTGDPPLPTWIASQSFAMCLVLLHTKQREYWSGNLSQSWT